MSKNSVILGKLETSTRFHPPLGLLYLADALEKEGYEVEIFHEFGSEENIQRLKQKTESNDPLYVGFSSMMSSALKPTIEASKIIKKYTDVPVVWGGVHPTIVPYQCLQEAYIDIIVMREGERTVVELTEELNGRKNLKKVKGIGYKEGKVPKITTPREFLTTDELDSYNPSWHLVDMEKYLQKLETEERVLPLVTSRGCPYGCTFCYNSVVNKRTWRPHSDKKVLGMLDELKEEYSIDGVMYYDDNFFVDRDRAIKILREGELPWWGEMRADYVDEDMAKEMYETDCRGIFIGAESGDEEILKLLNKEITPEQTLECVKLCRKYDINVELSMMIGLPGESEKQRENTFNFIDKAIEIYPKTKVSLKIYTPYPGTPLWSTALQHGLNSPKKTEDWATYERFRCNNPWIENPKELETACRVSHIANDNKYRYLSQNPLQKSILKLLEPIERFRWNHRNFDHSYEIDLVTSLNLIL